MQDDAVERAFFIVGNLLGAQFVASLHSVDFVQELRLVVHCKVFHEFFVVGRKAREDLHVLEQRVDLLLKFGKSNQTAELTGAALALEIQVEVIIPLFIGGHLEVFGHFGVADGASDSLHELELREHVVVVDLNKTVDVKIVEFVDGFLGYIVFESTLVLDDFVMTLDVVALDVFKDPLDLIIELVHFLEFSVNLVEH